MMPQAFGPFTRESLKHKIHEIVGLSDLVITRDQASCDHLKECCDNDLPFLIFPDFTNHVPPRYPENIADWKSVIGIVPNVRMLDKTSPKLSEDYIPFLAQCIHRVKEYGLEPRFIIHEGDDQALIPFIETAAGVKLKSESVDPLQTKGLLGSCFAVIGPRYHSLVGALSQGVPALGTSWTHKYAALFSDDNSNNLLISPSCSAAEFDAKIAMILEPTQRKRLISTLKSASKTQMQITENMWAAIESKLI
jgi:polysaccharide pyruvyl transferase WcaK-like protein